jgi:energy-coupling factor transport system permease protein
LEQSHVPYEFTFAFTTAVRFVPVLAEEAQTIMDAQKARGLELERGSFMKRIRNYIPILIPLIVSAIRRSLELAEAMESRAWGAAKKRTNLYVLKMRRGDLVLIIISVILLITAVYVRYFVHPIPTITMLLPK